MPKQKLTAQFIKGIRTPDTGRVDFQDTAVPGLVLRVTAKGHMSYSVSYWQKGRRPRVTLGDASLLSLVDAREMAREILRDVRLGIDPAAEKREAQRKEEEAVTFAQLARRYIDRWANVYNAKKSAREYHLRIEDTLIPRWGDWPAASIRKRDVRALIDEIVDRGDLYAANKMQGLISTIFTYGIREADVVENNPAAGLRRQPEKPRTRVLTDDELETVLPLFRREGKAGLGFRFLVLTGQRPNEVFGMRWSEVDGDVWSLPAERSKNGRPNLVPLSTAARAVLLDLMAHDNGSGYVFPSSRYGGAFTHYQRPASRVKKAAKLLENWRVYDLKSTCLTGLEKLGTPGHVVAAVANHAPQGVTKKHYSFYSFDAEKRDALTTWGHHVEKLDPTTRGTVVQLKR